MTRHTDNDNVELETALQELMLNLLRDGIKTNVRGRADFLDISCGHFVYGMGWDEWDGEGGKGKGRASLWKAADDADAIWPSLNKIEFSRAPFRKVVRIT